MSEIHTQYHKLQSLTVVERKEFEELKKRREALAMRRRDRAIYLGYVVIALLSTLLISGAMNFEDWKSLLW